MAGTIDGAVMRFSGQLHEMVPYFRGRRRETGHEIITSFNKTPYRRKSRKSLKHYYTSGLSSLSPDARARPLKMLASARDGDYYQPDEK